MDKLSIKFSNCFGIKNLEYMFDFKKHPNYIIYASNGMMKTSFTKTFKCISNGKKPSDEVFSRKTICEIMKDEKDISKDDIFVINSYEDEYISPNSAKLMVHKELRIKYDNIINTISSFKEHLFNKIVETLGSDYDVSSLFVDVLECDELDILEVLNNWVKNGLLQENFVMIDFNDIKYSDIFNAGVEKFLSDLKNIDKIKEYSDRYDELMSKSPIFKRGVFSHYNADNITDNLNENGFFDAFHTIHLNGIEGNIEKYDDLKGVIQSEKNKIFSDEKLKKNFAKIDAELGKRALFQLKQFIEKHPELIPNLSDYSQFKRKVFIGLLKNSEQELMSLLNEYDKCQTLIFDIKEQSAAEKTQWDSVLEIFKARFSVPFTIEVPNQNDVALLGNMPEFVFKYIDKDNEEEVAMQRKNLEKVLSQGEKRALYLLNIINDLEALKLSGEEKVVITDDIAESFDYKNKYAIIEYLQEMMQETNMRFIILTHNFDFYRTVSNRAKDYIFPQMVQRVPNGIEIIKPKYVFKNPFELMRKGMESNEDSDIITSIPFVRNLIEYSSSLKNNTNYNKLTSLLHLKENTKNITLKDLEDIFNQELHLENALSFSNGRKDKKVYDMIIDLARHYFTDEKETMDLDGKIIVSMAIRLLAEEYIIDEVTEHNTKPIGSIDSNQTGVLVKMYKDKFPGKTDVIKTLNKVLLMSSENIHINSFMFEPLIDISIKSLNDLFGAICIYCLPQKS